jgi:hypothetical protein
MARKEKFTPGPWRYGLSDSGHNVIHAEFGDGDVDIMQPVNMHDSGGDDWESLPGDESKANISLAVGAPDLYHAAVRARAFLIKVGEVLGGSGYGAEGFEVSDGLAEAIERARQGYAEAGRISKED